MAYRSKTWKNLVSVGSFLNLFFYIMGSTHRNKKCKEVATEDF